MKKMNPVVHFEMPYENRERMAAFYSKAFGWQTQMLGAEMGEYVVATTSEMNAETNFPKEPGRINGGFYKKMEDPKTHAPSFVIAVDDIYEAMRDVEAAGGTILGSSRGGDEPDDIPGVGLYISIQDSEGNRMSMLQPKPHMPIHPKENA